jgi:hypothetical protein
MRFHALKKPLTRPPIDTVRRTENNYRESRPGRACHTRHHLLPVMVTAPRMLLFGAARGDGDASSRGKWRGTDGEAGQGSADAPGHAEAERGGRGDVRAHRLGARGPAGPRHWKRRALHRGVPDQPVDPQSVQRAAADPQGAGAGRQVGGGRVGESARAGQPGLREGRRAVQASAVAGDRAGGRLPASAGLPDQAGGGRPRLHLVVGAADRQLRPGRRAAGQRQRAAAQPAGEHDLRLRRDLPGADDQLRVHQARAGALREPPRRRQRLSPPGLRRPQLLVHHPPAQRPHGGGVRRQPRAGFRAVQPAGAPGPRGGLRARRAGGQPVSRLSGGRRRPRDPVVLLATTTSTATPRPTCTRA